MQLMILAAGMGRRLRHFTSDKPKCMLAVNGKTLIEHSLHIASQKDLSRIVLVVGYLKEMIYELLGDSYNGIPITYVENTIYDKTNNVYSLFLARDLLVEDDTILMESDLIYEPKILDDLLANKAPNIVVVDKYKQHMDGTVIKIGGNNEVTAFISKGHFDYREVDSYYKTVNIYKFSKEFSKNTYVPFLESYCKVLGRNRYYEQVLRVILTLDQKNLKAQALNGEKWYEIDSIPDLRNAELLFSQDPKEKLALYERRYGGYWRSESVLDFCYLVNPYFPPPLMVEEIKRSFVPLMTNYPSGQATQALLASELFACRENQLAVGNGAAELIVALLKTLNGRIGVMLPTFNEYLAHVPAARLVKMRPADNTLAYSETDLIERLDEMDHLVLVNPDNPTGNFIPADRLMALLAEMKKRKKTLVLDESFVDFAANPNPHSLISHDILVDNPNLVIIKSISKSYGVPGFRLGVAATANAALLKKIRQGLSIWNINSFGEFFLQIAVKYKAAHVASCRQLAAVRERMAQELARIPAVSPLPSGANFILCRLAEGVKSYELAANLLFKNDILIKSCTGKEGLEDGQYIRLSVRSQKDNQALLAALHDELAGSPPA